MDDQTKRAVEDSYFLLAFLARAQIVIEGDSDRVKFTEYTKQIAEVQEAVSSGGTITPEQRAAFWQAFIFLSNVGAPATIESIKYYFQYYGYTDGRAALARSDQASRQARGRTLHNVFLLAVLLVTLGLSLLGFIGARTLDQYAADSRHWYNLVNVARLMSYGQPLQAAYDREGRTLLIGAVSSAPPAVGAASDPPRPAQALTSGPAPVISARDTTGAVRPVQFTELVQIPHDRVLRLRAALPNLLDSTDAVSEMGKGVWHPLCPTAEPCVRRRDVLLAEEFVFTLAGLHTERRILETLLWPITAVYRHFSPPPPPSRRPGNTPPTTCGVNNPFVPPDTPSSLPVRVGVTQGGQPTGGMEAMMSDPIRLTHIFLFILCNDLPMPINLPPPLNSMMTMGFKADLFLNVLNTYVLTLLFGVLGASVHVMRDINRRLDDFTLTRSILSRYWARVILGGVSGAFIGYFFNTGGQLALITAPGNPAGNLTSNLTGVALAFLAGFSVEVLFALLDRFTQVFREFAYGADAVRAQASAAGPLIRRVRVQ